MSAPAPDTVRPDPVANTSAAALNEEEILLKWTSSGDDGMSGTVWSYDIRTLVNTVIADDTACDSGRKIHFYSVPMPAPGDSLEYTVRQLSGGLTYHFCIRAVDEALNKSEWIRLADGSDQLQATTPYENQGPEVTFSGGVVDVSELAVITAAAVLPMFSVTSQMGGCCGGEIARKLACANEGRHQQNSFPEASAYRCYRRCGFGQRVLQCAAGG